MENVKLDQLISMIKGIDRKIDRILGEGEAKKFAEDKIGEKLFDNQDLCLMLNVTKKTMQRYRRDKIIPYYKIKGKIYYKIADIQSLIKKQ